MNPKDSNKFWIRNVLPLACVFVDLVVLTLATTAAVKGEAIFTPHLVLSILIAIITINAMMETPGKSYVWLSCICISVFALIFVFDLPEGVSNVGEYYRNLTLLLAGLSVQLFIILNQDFVFLFFHPRMPVRVLLSWKFHTAYRDEEFKKAVWIVLAKHHNPEGVLFNFLNGRSSTIQIENIGKSLG